MSEQDGTRATPKRHRSHQISKQSVIQRPTNDDKEAWKVYWEKQGQSWRTEPEIDEERQKYLDERRSITPVIEQDIYPFKDIVLSRADMEWLLTTHDNGRGPVDWNDKSQRKREGLDLRGADLHLVELRNLPLTCMSGGLGGEEWIRATVEQRNMARTHLEGADLFAAHLEGACLRNAHLQHAYLRYAYLEDADLLYAHLEKAHLVFAHLESANLSYTHLEGADLSNAHLEGTKFFLAHLEGKEITHNDLELVRKRVKEFPLTLEPVNFSGAFFDDATWFQGATLGNKQCGFVKLVDVSWNGTNLSVLNWTAVKMLGEEQEAHQRIGTDGKTKSRAKRFHVYRKAVRANRQLALALQGQGLNEESSYFAYRAQVLQRKVLWQQTIWGIEVVEWREEKPQDEPVLREINLTLWRRIQKFGRYLFSLLLDLLAGYGYKPVRSIIAYFVIIFGFMGLILLNAHFVAPHLRWDEALVLSVSSFHGRGFFSQEISLGDTYARLAALEAVIGLFIEISFIATFTKRFLGN